MRPLPRGRSRGIRVVRSVHQQHLSRSPASKVWRADRTVGERERVLACRSADMQQFAPLRSLDGHAVFLLLVQLALLIGVARVGAELAKRLGLPPVVGEMGAGIALGPTVLGHWA